MTRNLITIFPGWDQKLRGQGRLHPQIQKTYNDHPPVPGKVWIHPRGLNIGQTARKKRENRAILPVP